MAKAVSEQHTGSYRHLLFFSAFLIIAAFLFDSPQAIGQGFVRILLSPSNLITDYMALGGIGAALFNSGLTTLITVLFLYWRKLPMTGLLVAGIITVSGFALFGKNLYNSIPISLGVYLFAHLKKMPLAKVAPVSLFATALSPLVSELSFGLELGAVRGPLIGVLTGIGIGMITVPLGSSFLNFHQGFNLYNTGFTAGIIGMFATGILRMFDLQVNTISLLSSGNNLGLSLVLLPLFVVTFAAGFLANGRSLRGYDELLGQSGRLYSDFIELCGYGTTLINVAIMGFLGWGYVILVGGELNGATIGGILTLMGFSACGNHPRNTIPIVLGIFGASFLNIYDRSSTVSVLAALFGTTLAPIAGHYGPIFGLIAGFSHVSMVMNIGNVHGGMNLYNNGFAGGFIAATLVPLMNLFKERPRKTGSPGS